MAWHGRPIAKLAVVALLAAYVVESVWHFGGQGLHEAFRDAFQPLCYFVAAGLCLHAARRGGRDGAAWRLLGLGIAAYGTATLVYLLTQDNEQAVFYASRASHILWLSFYPAAYGAIMLLLQARCGVSTPACGSTARSSSAAWRRSAARCCSRACATASRATRRGWCSPTSAIPWATSCWRRWCCGRSR
jgi:hypothetical protein